MDELRENWIIAVVLFGIVAVDKAMSKILTNTFLTPRCALDPDYD